MILYDISRDILTTQPYEGDPAPQVTVLSSIENGDAYNMTQVTMCTHNATHIDAPKHFDDDGATIGKIRLSHLYGKCTVVTIDGVLTGEDMEELLPHCKKRLILHGRGNAYLTSSAAQVVAKTALEILPLLTPFGKVYHTKSLKSNNKLKYSAFWLNLLKNLKFYYFGEIMSILVAYYSRTEVTKKLAEAIAAETGADIEEIVSKVKYDGKIGFARGGKDAISEKIIDLGPFEHDVSDYDLVYLGVPVWAGKAANPMISYIKQNEGKFNDVKFFVTAGGSGFEGAIEQMEKYVGKAPLKTLTLVTKQVKHDEFDEELASFIE